MAGGYRVGRRLPSALQKVGIRFVNIAMLCSDSVLVYTQQHPAVDSAPSRVESCGFIAVGSALFAALYSS
jgi:hypothetical protein